jgi:hypothetical protein
MKKKTKIKKNWLTVAPSDHGDELFCERCKIQLFIELPLELSVVQATMSKFRKLHKNCRPRKAQRDAQAISIPPAPVVPVAEIP